MNQKDTKLLAKVLTEKGRPELAKMLTGAISKVEETQCRTVSFVIIAPVREYCSLRALPESDVFLIQSLVSDIRPNEFIRDIEFRPLQDERILKKEDYVFWLKEFIVERFERSDWTDFAYHTKSKPLLDEHHRFWNSYNYGNDDYEQCVYEIVEKVLEDFRYFDTINEYFPFKTWLKEKDIKQYTKLFPLDVPELDSLGHLSQQHGFDLENHITRLKNSVHSDPEQAIGSTKEMIESILKIVIVNAGEKVEKDDMPKLLKRVQKILKIDLESTENKEGKDILKKILSSLGQIIGGVNELRNHYGTGHGRHKNSQLSSRHAQLVVNSGIAVAIFLIETFHIRKTP